MVLSLTGTKLYKSVLPANASISLGSSSNKFAAGYFASLYADSIAINDTTSGNFVINSDNASNDAEDSQLEFERGTATPNAILQWDSINKRFDFNFSVSVNSGKVILNPTVSDSVSAVAFKFDTVNSLSQGKILSISSAGVDKIYVLGDGSICPAVNGTGMIGTDALRWNLFKAYNVSAKYIIIDNDGYLQLGSDFYSAQSGQIRMRNNTYIKARNAANTADISILGLSAGNEILFGVNGINIIPNSIAGQNLGSASYYWNTIYSRYSSVNGLRLVGFSSSASDPTTTELPNNQDIGIHKNTTSGTIYLAFNDGGTIKKIALT